MTVVLCSILLSGCGGGKYSVYTNLPEGSFSITDKSFTLAQALGAVPAFTSGEASAAPLKASGTTFYDIMASDADISVSYEDKPAAAALYKSFIAEVGEALDRVNNSLSVSVADSSLNAFNAAAAGETVEIDEISYEVLAIAMSAYEFTSGYYNPAVYYSAEAYGFLNAVGLPSEPEALPSGQTAEKLAELSSHFGELETFERDGKYYAKKPSATVEVGGETLSMKLDLGGVGKGYATDLISDLMDDYGYNYGYFDFGSSSMVCKNHRSYGSYNFGIRNPRANYFGRTFFSAEIACTRISTSSDDVRYYIKDGVRYCHVIDPYTGKPVQSGVISATVIGGSAAENDAYSTAIMAMGMQRALEFIGKLDRAAVFVCGG